MLQKHKPLTDEPCDNMDSSVLFLLLKNNYLMRIFKLFTVLNLIALTHKKATVYLNN